MPQVSIITGVYNQARYICQTIESVKCQTFSDYEHIIIDDGSADNTQEVLAPYRTQIVYAYQENQGNVASRNKGLLFARGDLIAILDGDDLWEPTKLEKQVAIMNQRPEVGLVYTGMHEINEEGKLISPMLVKDISKKPLRYQLLSNATPFSSMLIRRSALEAGRIIDPRFNLVGDTFLTLQIALQGKKFVCLPSGLTYIRSHASSMRYSAEYRERYLDQMLLVISEVQNDPRFPKNCSSLIKLATSRAYFTAAWLMIDRGDRTERQKAYTLLQRCLKLNWQMALPVCKQIIKSSWYANRNK